MSEPKYGTFHNVLTGETIIRELTAEEIAALPEEQETSNLEEYMLQQQQARESAIEKLSILGLTEDEINALLGGR